MSGWGKGSGRMLGSTGSQRLGPPRWRRTWRWFWSPPSFGHHLCALMFFSAWAGIYIDRGIWTWLWLPLLFVVAHALALLGKQ